MKMKRSDIGVALYLLAAVVMLIVPIPNWLLDVCKRSSGYVIFPDGTAFYNHIQNCT